jgi:hypothetical protein
MELINVTIGSVFNFSFGDVSYCDFPGKKMAGYCNKNEIMEVSISFAFISIPNNSLKLQILPSGDRLNLL